MARSNDFWAFSQFALARVRVAHRCVRFREQGIELDRLHGRRPHAHQCFLEGEVRNLPGHGRVGVGLSRVGGCERGILRDDLLEQRGGPPCVLGAPAADQRSGSQIHLVRFHRWLISPLPSSERQAKLVDDAARDLVLDREDLLERSIVPVRPERNIAGDGYELCVDPQPLTLALNRPCDDQIDPKLRSDRGEIAGRVLEDERRRRRPHLQPVDHGEIADDFLCQPVYEVVVVGLGAEILERQHGDHGRLRVPYASCGNGRR
jgi:hypothetical protein